MNSPVITIDNLSKRFRVYDRPLDRLKEWLTPRGVSYHWAFWALREISLSVAHGSSMGIIGANGAGKSTLLKILCGTLSPTTGSVHIDGRIAGMLELGAGFHPEFTGRQNIYLNARLLGLSDAEIEARLPAIIEFAELGDFLDHPLRIYSTGMALRLGFSVAANIDPDILIIDEALAVGDAYFQQKCLRHLRRFSERGGTLLFVSHDPGAIRLLCDDAVLLHEGRIIEHGAPDDVLNYYNALIARRTSDAERFRIERARGASRQPAVQRSGTFDAVITRVDVCVDGTPTRTLQSGANTTIEVEASALADVPDATVGISIRDRLGYEVFGTNTHRLGCDTPSLRAGERIHVAFSLPVNLGPGEYNVTAAVHTGADHLLECYDWADKFVAFKILAEADQYFQGVARLPVAADVNVRHDQQASPSEVLESLFGGAPSEIRFDDESSAWTFAGWHAPEQVGDRVVRWTQEQATFVMRAGAGAKLNIELATEPSLCTAGPLDVTLAVNGEDAGTCQVADADWQIVRFELPARHAGQVVRCAVRSGRTCMPAEVYGSNDRRTLGIMVRRIWSE
jgi:lipopolysaccharide transport system ATP-binding protein